GRDLDDDIGAPGARGLQVPVEKIGRMSSKHRNVRPRRDLGDGIVARVHSRRNHEIDWTVRCAQALEHAPKERLSGERQENLPGEAARSAARLYDDEHQEALAAGKSITGA